MIDDLNLHVDGKISTSDIIGKVERGGYRE